MDSPRKRLPAVDLVKAVAAQLVVLHHLAAYGPLSEAMHELLPTFADWCFDRARMAVQVFLVVGGYLTARGLFPRGLPYSGSHATVIANRYLRLALPFAAALALAVTCAAVARLILDDDSIPPTPSVAQTLAHLFLLQGLLDYESLTVGAWYVAIDFQLFVSMVLVSWLALVVGRRAATYLVPVLVAVLMGVSLFYFNRQASMDAWALYFFGAYGLGALTYWLAASSRGQLGMVVIVAVVLAALWVDFRGRIAVALATALVLAWASRPLSPRVERWMALPVLGRLAETSYALFLVHYPVLLLGNAVFALFDAPDGASGLVGLATTWLACIVASVFFFRWVEQPAGRLRVAMPMTRRLPDTAAVPQPTSRVFAS